MRTLILVCLLAAPAWACLWDDDALVDEKRGLPGMAALLADKYERHSELYYKTRIERSRAQIAKDPKNGRAHDNLIAALDRLGRYEEALAAGLAKEAALPGQYTTAANLGTVYYHLGRLDEAALVIQRALTINPDAHFGREAFQLALVKGTNWQDLKGDAVQAFAGMIRFSDPRSPELWCALGEALNQRGDRNFAVRAFLRAQEAGQPGWTRVERGLRRARGAITYPTDIDPELIASERAAGRAWTLAYQEFEDALIRSGKFPENESDYEDFYRSWGHCDDEPVLWTAWEYVRAYGQRKNTWLILGVIAGVVFLIRRAK